LGDGVTTRAESPTIRLAVVCLGSIAGISAVGIIGLSATDRLQDAALAALSGIAGGASGALATLLTTFTPAPLPGGRRVSDQIPPIPDLETEQFSR
jgi:high-affinity K+ transport system ATPase subunit B